MVLVHWHIDVFLETSKYHHQPTLENDQSITTFSEDDVRSWLTSRQNSRMKSLRKPSCLCIPRKRLEKGSFNRGRNSFYFGVE